MHIADVCLLMLFFFCIVMPNDGSLNRSILHWW